MTSRAEQIRQQAALVATQASTRSAAGAQARSQVPTPPRQKKVGKTVNLDVELNQRALRWQADAATTVGLPRVTFQAVVDSLLEELLDDDLLALRVRDRIVDAANLDA